MVLRPPAARHPDGVVPRRHRTASAVWTPA
jgi:hypothetical protein